MAETFKGFGIREELPETEEGWRLLSRPGGWWIAERRSEGGILERRRLLVRESKGKIWAQTRGRSWYGEVLSEARVATGGAGDADLTAQFPGKVRKILVREGDRVAEGQSLILVEAMKMEFTVKAPFEGQVKRVRVREGQQLSPGDLFVELEGENGQGK